MSSITVLFPHQLFRHHPGLKPGRPVCLVEEYLFFRQYRFHKQKLVYHRASMKAYEAWLISNGYSVLYTDSSSKESDIRLLIPRLVNDNYTEIHIVDPVDDWLGKRISASAEENKLIVKQYPNPGFLNQLNQVTSYFDTRKTYFQTDFYVWQRKSRQLLLDPHQQPLGGKWTFDTENRQRFPKSERIPGISPGLNNEFIQESIAYINHYFPDNYGSATPFIYPVDFTGAQAWLNEFLEERLEKFGMYEDAMVKDQSFLYHSVLTPMLNTGLLEPQDVLNKLLYTAAEKNIPLNSLEGFLRQITGWREFIRIVYEREGRRQRTRNYWGFTRKIPDSFRTGETGILPVDMVIKRILQTGYAHHIERLMVLGNFMLLCEFDPDEVYRWFMEMFIDSYDWVMVPNVYGMTQFADGGLMTTKPYISGSNYLLKMGNWEKGEWQEIWDGLFWRFMHGHRDFFSRKPRLGMLLGTYDKMPEEKRNRHLAVATDFLKRLDQ